MNQDDDAREDVWSRWLLNDRHGGDASGKRKQRAEIERYADRVIDGLALSPGMTLLDVGTGDGLVAFRAIDRVGASLRVVLSDVSTPLLRFAQARAQALRVASQCRFVEGSADHMEGIEDASIDALAMRAVLAYVHDKRAAVREAYRVLRPRGRMSLAEPLFQDDALNTIALGRIARAADGGDERLASVRLLHRWKSAQYPNTPEALAASPLANHSERDLLALVEDCGFEDILMELHIAVRRSDPLPWATFLASAPHPWAPTLGQVLDERFDAVERMQFERLLRPSIEAGVHNAVERVVYLTAGKPAESHLTVISSG